MTKANDTEKPYHVYAHIHDLDVFYIGKGLKYRPHNGYHRSKKWHDYVDSIGGDYEVVILSSHKTSKEALKREKHLIDLYRPCCNSAFKPKIASKQAKLRGTNRSIPLSEIRAWCEKGNTKLVLEWSPKLGAWSISYGKMGMDKIFLKEFTASALDRVPFIVDEELTKVVDFDKSTNIKNYGVTSPHSSPLIVNGKIV